jgi:peroxiredoxin
MGEVDAVEQVVLWEGDQHRARGAAGRPGVIAADALAAISGWELRPEGLCNGDACVPVRDPGAVPAEGLVDLAFVAPLLDRPVVVDAASGVTAVGATHADRRRALVDRVAPSFTLPDLDGAEHTLEELQGRVTVLTTFSSWCGCRYDLPGWQALSDELADEGLAVIAVAFDQEADVVRPFTEDLTIPVLYDKAHVVSELYAISNVPTVVWIDEEGRIARPNTPAFGTDLFTEFHGVPAGPHLDAIRQWVRSGAATDPSGGDSTVAVGELSDDEIEARLWFRIGAFLHAEGRDEEAAPAFARASALAPLDFTVARAAMPLTGRDPFGEEFMALYAEWDAAGRPFHGLQPDMGG